MNEFIILAALSLSGCTVYTAPLEGQVYVTPAPVVIYEPYYTSHYTYSYYGYYGWGRHRSRDHYDGEREHHHRGR